MREITLEQATILTGRGERPYEVKQLEAEDGEARGYWLRALSAEDRRDAEAASLREVRKGVWEVDEWTRACEEVARGISRPAGLTARIVATWNEAIVREIHYELNITAYMVVSRVHAELQAAMGAPPPPIPEPTSKSKPRRTPQRPPPSLRATDSEAPRRDAA
jgi:hypothetical protein